MVNNISIEIPDELHAKSMTDIQLMIMAYKALCVTLTAKQRQELLKMGPKTHLFVERSNEYATSNPEFLPVFVDKPEWDKDTKATKKLVEFHRFVQQLDSMLDDTIMVCGSESYTAALTFYGSAQQAAKNNVPAAKIIVADLKERFTSKSTMKAVPAEELVK